MQNESKIFKNEEILNPEFLPDILPHRENQIKILADNLLPLSRSRIPQNTFIFGLPGIGKTHVVKYVFRQFEEYSEKVKTVYINCWDYKTSHSILSKIALELGVFVQRRGVGKDEVLEKLIEACKKMNKGIAVCLDEVDQLIFKDKEALYDFLRINQYIKNPFGLIFISNNPNVFIKLEPRIKSSLDIDELEFKPYSLEEMKRILLERLKNAFFHFEDGVAILTANHAVKKGGDVRVGLQVLVKAGKIAENNNEDKLRVDHVKEVLKEVNKIKPEILKKRISENEKIIVDLVKTRERWTSGDLYSEYGKIKENPVSERFFRDLLKHLAEVKLIKMVEVKRGFRGKTRFITKS